MCDAFAEMTQLNAKKGSLAQRNKAKERAQTRAASFPSSLNALTDSFSSFLNISNVLINSQHIQAVDSRNFSKHFQNYSLSFHVPKNSLIFVEYLSLHAKYLPNPHFIVLA